MGLKEKSRTSKLGGKPTSIHAFGGLSKPRTQPILAVALSLILFIAASLLIVPYAKAADPGHAASSISSGQFESGDYTFPVNLTVNKFFIANGTTLFVDAINGRVGIGTTGPGNKLDVNGAIGILAENPLRFYDSAGTSWASIYWSNGQLIENYPLYLNNPTTSLITAGNVGIGTTSPTTTLNVKGILATALSGTVNTSSGSTTANTSANLITEIRVGDAIKITNVTNSEIFTVSAITASNITLDSAASYTWTNVNAYKDSSLFRIDNGDGTGKVVVDKSGSVGIGTASPNYLLETKVTEKAANLSSVLYVNGTSGNVGIGTASPGAKLDVGGKLSVTGGYTPTTGQNGIHFAFSSNTGTIYSLEEGAAWRDLKIDAATLLLQTTWNGNVGIGTTSPSAKLEIQGSGTGGLSLNVTGDLFVNDTSGNVGIGTASPANKLHVYSDPNDPSLTPATNPQIFRVAASDSIVIDMGALSSSPYNAWMQSRDIGGAGAAKALSINPLGGNVGIGTTSPSNKLEVAGDINASSGSLIFYNELMPDGASCSNGQILKKTGANDWDCADDTGGGGNSTEEMQDAAGGLFGGTETLITVTYDDANNDTDFVVPEMRNTTEEMQDAVGGGIDVTLNYTDAADKLGLNRTWLNNSGVSNSSWYWGNFRVSSGACSNVCTDADTSCSLGTCTVGSDDTLSNPTVGANLSMSNYLIENIGNAGTDFTSGGGLNLAGNLGITGTVSNIIAGNSTFDGGTLFVDSNNDKVGIGNTGPDTALHVQGGVCVDTDAVCTDPGSGNISVTNTLSTAAVKTTNLYDSDNSNFFDLSSCGDNTYVSSVDATGLITCAANSGGGGGWATSGGYVYNTTTTGVGIGTASPNYLLETKVTEKAANLSSILYVNGTSGYVGIGTASPSAKLMIQSGGITEERIYAAAAATQARTWWMNGDYSFGSGIDTNNKYTIWANVASPASLVTIDSTGNVGIGTASPNYLMETKVTEKAVNLSSILYVNGTSGNVGIGTVGSGQKLTVEGGSGGSIEVARFQSAGTAATWISLYDSGTGTPWGYWAAYPGGTPSVRIGTVSNHPFDIGTNDIARMRIEAGGNISMDSGTLFVDATGDRVGIGTTGPGKKLEVSDGTKAITFDPAASTPTINTTALYNLTITSSGGNVIIQLG